MVLKTALRHPSTVSLIEHTRFNSSAHYRDFNTWSESEKMMSCEKIRRVSDPRHVQQQLLKK